MAASVELHFDGDIVTQHRVSVRTLGRSLVHLQSALDRAYIEQKYGSVWKHARLKTEDYPHVEFIAQYPEPGGFRIKAIADEALDSAEKLTRRIWDALTSVAEAPANTEGADATRLTNQVDTRRMQIAHEIVKPQTYLQLLEHPDKAVVRAYGDRSIGKEWDQILTVLRHRNSGESTLEIGVEVGRQLLHRTFGRQSAANFHRVVSRRELGAPVIYEGTLRSLDRGGRYNLRHGKFTLLVNQRDITLHIATDEDFQKLVPYLRGKELKVIGAPVIEFGAHDPRGGDVFFVDLLED